MQTFSQMKLDALIERLKRTTGRRWTIREIAQATDVSPSYLTLLKNGKRQHPSMDVVMKLSRFFQVAPEELLEADMSAASSAPVGKMHPVQSDSARQTLSFCDQLISTGNPQQALELLSLLQSSVLLHAEMRAEVRLLTASAQVALKRLDDGLATFHEFIHDSESTYIRALAYQMRARCYFQQEKYKQAITDYLMARDLAEAVAARELLFKIHYSLGLCYKETGGYGASIYHYEYALRCFPDDYPVIHKAHLLMGIGNTHLRLLNSVVALQSYQQAETIYAELQDTKYLADIRHNIARVEALSGDYERSIEQFHQSMQAHQSVGDHLSVGQDMLELAYCYKALERWDQVNECALRASITFENGNKTGLAARAKSLLIEAMINRGSESVDTMLPMVDHVLTVFESLDWPVDLANAYRLKGDLYLAKGEHEHALSFSMQAIKMYETLTQSTKYIFSQST